MGDGGTSFEALRACAGVSGQNFLVDDIYATMSVVRCGNKVQAENTPGVGLHVHGVKIVGVWIKGHLAGLELHPGNKGNAGGRVHQVWARRINVRIEPAQAKSTLIA